MAETIRAEITKLQAISTAAGFGGFVTGDQLARGFGNKVREGMAHLMEYSSIAHAMADNFRAIEASFASQDRSNADVIGAIGGRISDEGGQ